MNRLTPLAAALLLACAPALLLAADTDTGTSSNIPDQSTEPVGATPRPGQNVELEPAPTQGNVSNADRDEAEEADPKGATPRPGINVETEPTPGQEVQTNATHDEAEEVDPKGATPRPGINVETQPGTPKS